MLVRSYVAPEIRFCFNDGQRAICEGVRTQATTDYLPADSGAARASPCSCWPRWLSSPSSWSPAYSSSTELKKHIIAASLPFCLIIALGAATFVSSVFLSTGLADTARCHARVWMMCMGFVLILGSFVLKVRRIDAIFQQQGADGHEAHDRPAVPADGATAGRGPAVEVLLLALCSDLSGLGYEAVTSDDVLHGSRNKFHTACAMTNSTGGSAMVEILSAPHGPDLGVVVRGASAIWPPPTRRATSSSPVAAPPATT